ncbi:MAG TPA: enoyl-CoA hydratase/isomerase family protein [Ktedonobacterales bacterium]
MAFDQLKLEFLRTRLEDGIAIIELNRPPANAHHTPMILELDRAVTEVRFDERVRAVVLASASDKFFSAGADIQMIRDESGEQVGLLSQTSKEVILKMRSVPKVFIGVINGHCMGGGLELALACDYRYAGRGTWKVGLPEVNLGLIPGEGGTQMLGRIMGPAKALKLMVTGETFSPEQATEWGLFNELVDADKVWDTAMDFARLIAQGPTKAIGFMKVSLTEALEMPLKASFDYERQLQNQLFETADSKEGVRAFLEKRKPNFTGR